MEKRNVLLKMKKQAAGVRYGHVYSRCHTTQNIHIRETRIFKSKKSLLFPSSFLPIHPARTVFFIILQISKFTFFQNYKKFECFFYRILLSINANSIESGWVFHVLAIFISWAHKTLKKTKKNNKTTDQKKEQQINKEFCAKLKFEMCI